MEQPERSCRYDSATGSVIFATTHFSYYAVGYHSVNFQDVAPDSWYRGAVEFVSARNIASGTAREYFSPDINLTRGQLLVMVMKAYGLAAETNPSDNFSDAGNTYYTNYLAAAKKLGITEGIGGNLYAPEKEISRQEVFVLLCNTLKTIGKQPHSGQGASNISFTDGEQIADWAKDAVLSLADSGMINGTGGKLFPGQRMTRAEMAQLLKNSLSK
jgi:S-layer homology domain.